MHAQVIRFDALLLGIIVLLAGRVSAAPEYFDATFGSNGIAIGPPRMRS